MTRTKKFLYCPQKKTILNFLSGSFTAFRILDNKM